MSNFETRSYVHNCAVLGNGDIGLGRELYSQLSRWVDAAADKHRWPAEVDGIKNALRVCTAEFRELEEAIVLFHPDEHVAMELLDTAAVILRMLAGEHIRDPKARIRWQRTVRNVRPLPKGHIGPWDVKAKDSAEIV